MEEVNKLLDIWVNIPKSISKQVDFTQKEIISRYVDAFHIGEYFYMVFNTQSGEIEFVDERIEMILGYAPEKFSLSTLLEIIHPDDLPYFFHYEQSAVRFFSRLSQAQLYQYKFSYDYRIRLKDKIYKRVLQQVIPIFYFPEGGARTLVIFTDLTHFNLQGIPKLSFIGMQGAPSYYNVHLEEDFKLNETIFTKKELEILQYVIQGMRSEDISKLLNRSIYTVRTHRKNILKKSGCRNVQELLMKSVREGWL